MSDADDDEPQDAGAEEVVERKPMQAVVVIHGMGEQRPMSTIRAFVDAVWSSDPDIVPNYGGAGGQPNKSWITPDRHTGSHELRRITTPYDLNGRRTDFYELYWADLVQGTTRGRLFAWIKELLLRRREDIPRDAKRLYWATWVFVLLVAASTALLALSMWLDWVGPVAGLAIFVVASGVLWALDHFVLPWFGDVAAYVQATPATVENRAKVRERGLALLRALSDDDRYDRIVLVSHSLGSIIAYDLLHILWAERRPRGLEWPRDRAVTNAVRAVEPFAALTAVAPTTLDAARRAEFRHAQWQLHSQLRSEGPTPWKISDFVTLGSPLTHAEFLVTFNEAQFRKGIGERLFGICPPLSDSAAIPRLLYYEKPRVRAVHHGAVFAATRWTNIYDLGNLLTTGDPISGAMADNFGGGVEEVRVEMESRRWGRLFTHTRYWDGEATGYEVRTDGVRGRTHLEVLRDAVDLRRAADIPL